MVGTIMDLIRLIRLLGPRRLLALRRNYRLTLPALRGYVITTVFWSLLEEGFMDRLKDGGRLSPGAYAGERGLDRGVLQSLCVYLEGAGLLALEGDECLLTPPGLAMLAEPRGIYELVRGYRPLFDGLGDLLAGKIKYGVDIAKEGEWVARGTGRLGSQLPFPIIAEVVRRRGYGRILDLKCNDGALLVMLAERGARRGFGIDDDPAAIKCALSAVSAAGMGGRIDAWEGDLFDVGGLSERCGDIDLIIAFDVFHEHLCGGPGKIVKLIGKLGVSFPGAHLLIAEFCRLPEEKVSNASKPFLEHELIHGLTGQKVLSESEWEELIAATPYSIIEKRVFGLIGHGYFLLK